MLVLLKLILTKAMIHLLNVPEFLKTSCEFINSTYNEINNEKEFEVIAKIIENNKRVLDVGC